MTEPVLVRCLVSRRVADDDYIAGTEYAIDPTRAAKYADYFLALSPAPQPADGADPEPPQVKERPTPENKDRGRGRTKRDDAAGDKPGWPGRNGGAVHLDGTPAE